MTDLRTQLQSTLGSAYQIDRELGGGGMSRVFVATETALKREVVVKVLPPELVAGVNVERFRREILLAAGLQHPHIVPVLATGETDGLPWFTMPFVQGESLRQRMARGPMAINETIDVLRDVSKALVYAHARGVVHRDIKPDNVLLSGGSAVVTDFGIAKALSAARSDQDASETRGALTQIGTSIGTPMYMAPEQAAADPATDSRADLYSFGCMAYELLTGRPPFTGMTPQRLLAAHMSERPAGVTDLRPDTPPLLAELIMRCLEKDAAKRPQNAQDVLRTLEIAATTASGDTHDAASAVLIGRRVPLRVALVIWLFVLAAAFVLAKAAIVGIGLPAWVLPGALIVAGLGLPVILFTAFVQRTAHRVLTATPTLTPGGTTSPRGTMATIAMRASPHVSWARTVRGGTLAFGAFMLLIAGFMAMRAMGIGPAGSLFASGKLNEQDRLVLSDFTVASGDSSIGTVVTEAVRSGIGQSAVLSILSPGAVGAALERMKLPGTRRVDATLARQIALREGATGVISGDVTPIGTGFVLTLRLVTADSGTVLTSFQETADSPKELLPTIDKLARRLREKAGESLKSVHRNPPLEQVTTTSLDALRKYAEAVRAHDIEGEYERSVDLLREAIREDSTFAMAYRKLYAALSNAGYGDGVAIPMLTRAYQLREHLTERERVYVEGYHFAFGQGRDRAKGIALLNQLVDANDQGALITLARAYMSRRETARAETLLNRAREMNPANTIAVSNQVQNYVSAGRLGVAWDTLSAADQRDPGSIVNRVMMLTMLWERGKRDSAEAIGRELRGKTQAGLKIPGLYYLELMAQAGGRIDESALLRRQWRTTDSARGGRVRPLDDSLTLANDDAWFRGNTSRAASRVERALSQFPLLSQPENETRPDMRAAVILARAGKPDRARGIIAQWDANVRDTSLKRWMEPYRHEALGEIALAENKPRVAVDEFRMSGQLPDGPLPWCEYCREAQLGLAFDRAGMPDSAIAALERYVSAKDADLGEAPYLAGAYKRLGELYEAKGDIPKAITSLQQFVELWKNADPDLQPKVADARARLARLLKQEKR